MNPVNGTYNIRGMALGLDLPSLDPISIDLTNPKPVSAGPTK